MMTRWLALLGLSGAIIFVIAIAALHVLQPQLSPLHEAMSYYVHGAHGWMMMLALVSLGVGSLAITAAIGITFRARGDIVGTAALAVWSLGALAGGVFPADPPGNWNQPPSMSGAIHGVAAMVAIAAFPLAAIALTRNIRRDPHWQRFAGLARTLAAIAVVSFIAFLSSLLPVVLTPGPPILLGLTERVMLAAYTAWLMFVAVGLFQNSRHAAE